MSTYQHNCNSDFRNEGWTFSGTGVDACWKAWSAIGDDTKFCHNPANKGRGCVKFPVDIDTSSVPDGAVIESITLFLRVNKTDSVARSVTVNLLCSDDTSQFTQRTINNVTTTITTIEVGTFTTDALGRPWDKDRLNRIMCQIFSYCGIADKIRCYEFYAVINYRVRPTIIVTAPTGTVTTPSPTITWTYSQTDGDPQKKAQYKIVNSADQEKAQFNPDTFVTAYSGTVTGDITSLILPFAVVPDDYFLYVRSQSTHNAWSAWSDHAFTVQGGAPGVPGGTFGGIGAGGGGGFESVIGDATVSAAYLTIRDGSNLMPVMGSDFETTADGLGFTTTNCTQAQDTTSFFNVGSGSLKLTASTAATMSVSSSFLEVDDGAPMTVRCQFKSKVTGRTVNLRILWFDNNYASLSGTITGTGSDLTTTWTEVAATGTSPVGAAYAKVQAEIVSPANAEVHNIDGIGLMYGTNSVWSNGGHASRNLLSDFASSAEDPIVSTGEPWAAASAATTYTRVASTGTGSDGSKQFKLTYVGLSPTLSFVATGTVFTDTTTGTGYTLNKPVGVADNDLLIAYVASDTGIAATPPTGWITQDTVSTGTSSLTVLTRDGLAADPSTWTGNMTASATRKRAVVVAYRGAAASSLQFLSDNVGSSTSGSLTPTTPTVNNTDPNAWRLSAFVQNDDVTAGASVANILPPGTPNPISFVAAATEWTGTTTGTTFQINKPVGIQSGDLMIATVNIIAALTGGGSAITPPSGWTTVQTITQTDSQSEVCAMVMKRTATSSEPSSWSGSITGSGALPMITQNVAYRNCDTAANQFISNGQSTNDARSSITTATISNTNSLAWRVSIFIGSGSRSGGSWTSTETIERCDDYAAVNDQNNSENGSIACYDSNGPVSTGSYSKSGTYSDNAGGGYRAAASWIGFIKPLASPPAPGGNETERTDGNTGASTPVMNLSVYDSAGVAVTGTQSVTQQFTPGSGTATTSSCQWIAILKPSAPTVSGEAGAVLSNYVDFSSIDPAVIARAGGQMTYVASFLGSTSGTPYLTVFFYRGNELISTQVAQGNSFNSSTWTKSAASFPIPDGTTRLKLGVKSPDHAVNDIVYYDCVSIAFGTSTVFRRGTGRATHPIFSVPLIEYAEDRGTGYGDFAPLPATDRALLQYDQLSGLVSFVDQTLVPQNHRKYRARTQSFGLAGDTFMSQYGPESGEVFLVATDFWLKDLQNTGNALKLKVLADPLAVKTTDTSAVFQALGADRPVVITEGYKGDVIQLTVACTRLESPSGYASYVDLRALLNANKTLYLQTSMDNAWWVRPVGDIEAAIQAAGYGSTGTITNPLRFVKLQFVEVDPEA